MLPLSLPFLLLLLPIPFLVHRWAPPYATPQEGLRVPFFQNLVSLTGQTPTRGATILQPNWAQRLLVPLCWGLLVIALAQPQWLGEPITQVQSARDLMLMVDLSQSMEARDFTDDKGNTIDRLGAVKQVLNEALHN
jgi:Ca-activated chloride channel family protein